MLLLASLIAVVHGILVCCVVVGSVEAIAGRLRRWRRLELAFYCLIGLLIASDRILGECVLTRWEQAARNMVT